MTIETQGDGLPRPSELARGLEGICQPSFYLFFGVVLSVTFGCGRQEQVIPEKRPRPVTVQVLHKRQPVHASLVSASVGSWKTEQIGFEVNGRVKFVVEPNTEIEGRIRDKEGNLILEGTPIAEIDDERYQLQLAKAKADVTRAEQTLLAAQTEANESIPAQIAAAEASRDLAKIEYDRSQRLLDRNAGAKGDVDRDKANYENAVSQLKQLDAAKKAKLAEIESLRNAKLQALQSQRDAERNLEDCTLYSSFRGQIADIAVVPGSVVSAGQPVATIQMMDPIKVEVEVSAEDSRRLQQTERLPVMVTMPDGSVEAKDGYLYLIDPVADPLTRTFTLTLLVMNEKFSSSDDETIPTTDQMWRLDFKFLPGAEENMLFADEKALLKDEKGYYLWQVTNRNMHEPLPGDKKIRVQRLRVTLGPRKIPYLGNWVFQQVFVDDEQFDPTENLVIGELKLSDGEEANQWNGDTVVVDPGGQWMLRPGDLVRVDLTGNNAVEGFFVPMDAIARQEDQTYIFAAQDVSQKTVVKRVAVKLVSEVGHSETSSLRRIEPVDGRSLEGLQYVVEGAHYLIDGEEVNAVKSAEATP